MRKLHWSKVKVISIANSVWSKVDDESVDLDTNELEAVFGQKPRGKAKKKEERGGEEEEEEEEDKEEKERKEKEKREKEKAKKKEKIRLVDDRRAYNADICLARFRMSPVGIADAIRAADDEVLTEDRLVQLLNFTPTSEEISAVKSYEGPVEDLGFCERYFLSLSDIPRVETRLKLLLFKAQYPTLLAELEAAVTTVKAACLSLSSSNNFQELLRLILAIGNYLNGGSQLGQTHGFDLTTLCKLQNTKSVDNRTTLLQYIVATVHAKYATVEGFIKELEPVLPAASLDHTFVSSELNRFGASVRLLQREIDLLSSSSTSSLSSSLSPTDDDMTVTSSPPEEKERDSFGSMMAPFSSQCSLSLSSLTSKFDEAMSELKTVCNHFAFADHKSWNGLLSLVKTFVVQYSGELDALKARLDRQERMKKREAKQKRGKSSSKEKKEEEKEEESERERDGSGKKKKKRESKKGSDHTLVNTLLSTLRGSDMQVIMKELQRRRLHLDGVSSRTLKQIGFPTKK